eukprot:TRINITY_DN31073_c0_g1_i1.p1 TRINITY_DN31073_c0_g1~~TRINITY_DN31073_c0_g1_i1.p1  ORF type:complete len:200 (+),score=15.84 TRINITY_DN31073_c0_g1_i1:58-657(+)
MANSMYNPAAIEGRKGYPNSWQVEMWQAPVKDFPFACITTFCSPCTSFWLRQRVLYNDMSRYQCCGGFLPCSGHCGEAKCPTFCLFMEVWCCFPSSVAATRYLIQDQLNIMNSKCDNGIIAFLVFLEQLACLFACLACILQNDAISDAAHVLRCLADVVYCSVCTCMQTQHKVELDHRDSTIQQGAAPMAPPPQQAMHA